MFHKNQRRTPPREIERALRAQADCEGGHPPAEMMYAECGRSSAVAGHTTWRTTRHRRLGQGSIHPDPAYTEAYQAAQEALRLGQRVYDRRTELGLTQAELAQRAGMTQPQVSRLETGGATPTLPLLRRLATALEADVVIYSDSDSDGIGFTPHSNAA